MHYVSEPHLISCWIIPANKLLYRRLTPIIESIAAQTIVSRKNDAIWRISHGTAPFEAPSKLHHFIGDTPYSIFDVVVYAHAPPCGAKSSVCAFSK